MNWRYAKFATSTGLSSEISEELNFTFELFRWLRTEFCLSFH